MVNKCMVENGVMVYFFIVFGKEVGSFRLVWFIGRILF